MSGADWMDEWMRAWRAFPDAGEGSPWSVMLEQLTRSHRAGPDPAFADAAARITQQSRTFLDLGQALASARGADWKESVFRYLDELDERLRDPEEAVQLFGGMPALDCWRDFAGSDGEAWMSGIDALLRMPGIGYTREHQEAFRELCRLWRDYERAYRDYAAWSAETARLSLDKLRGQLASCFDDGDGPASIRALYDAWAECCGEVYADRVATDDYAKLQGRMVNAYLAHRRQAGRLIDEWARMANLPTREEVDAQHRKLAEMRRELRDLQARAGPRAPPRKARRAGKKRQAKKKAAGRK